MNARVSASEAAKAERHAAAMGVLQAFVMAQKSHTITRRMAIEAYLGADMLLEVSEMTRSQLKTELASAAFGGTQAP